MRNEVNDKENIVEQESVEISTNALFQSENDEAPEKQPLRKTILRIVVAVVLILAVITTAAILFVSINRYYSTSKQTEDYFKRADVIENDIKTNLDVLNDKFALARLDSFFTKDEVYSFAYNLWKYELLINNQPVASTETLTIAPGDVISIKESLDETMLPSEFLAYGNLTRGDVNDSLKNHFSLNKKTYILNAKQEGLSTVYTVEDLSVTKGEEINLLLSVQLQERLDFERDVIVVTVR